jgi:putative transposase
VTKLHFPCNQAPVARALHVAASASNQKINLSQVFPGQNVDIKQVSDRIWLVAFIDYDLGYFDDETCSLEPLENPSVQKCYPCHRNKP